MPNFIDRLKDLKDAINTQADKLPELNDVKDILESYSDLESKKDTFSDGDVVKVFTDSKTMQYYRITKDSSGTATITALSTKPVIGVPDVLASTSEIGLFQLPSESTLESTAMSIQKDIEVTAHENHGYFDLTQVLGKVNSIDYSEVFDRVYNSDYKYFTLYSTTSFTFSTTSTASLEYSIDGGNTWTSYTANSSITSGSVNSRYEIKLRGTGNTKIDSGFTISGTAVSIEDNISTLLDYTKHQSQIYPDKNAFASLLKDNTCISNISGLNLDLINLSEGIYSYMFSGCTGITSICPTNENALLSTIKRTSKNMCSYMFENCTGLTTIDLKFLVNTNVIVAEDSCYESMFSGCTSLEFKPKDYTYTFPATVLKDKCYYHMFYNTGVKISNSNTTTEYSKYSLNLPYKLDSRYYKSTSLEDMFGNTQGEFTGTPNIDSTYYLYNFIVKDPFIIQSASNTSFTFKLDNNSSANLEYSLDDNEYIAVTKNTTITATKGKLYLRGINNTIVGIYSGIWSIKYPAFKLSSSVNDIKVSGNILNLLNYQNNPNSMSEYAFGHLFYGDSCISDCSKLILPAFTSNYCYEEMFNKCTNLTKVPTLSADSLAEGCYSSMFAECTSLTSAPALPATTLANKCYSTMFGSCTSLAIMPALPATTLADECYSTMFAHCNSLTSIPTNLLQCNKLAKKCYSYMFFNCNTLISGPELPATELADECYSNMFAACFKLTSAPALPATTLANKCYSYMFEDCTSLTSAPALQATTLASECYSWMFKGCTSLTSAPELPATTLASYCYYNMFYNCTSLSSAPKLPATTLASYCYWYMFSECTSLISAPELPATTLANDCYREMFSGCSKIDIQTTMHDDYIAEYRIPSSGTGTTATDALTNMFTNTAGTMNSTPEINTTYYVKCNAIILDSTSDTSFTFTSATSTALEYSLDNEEYTAVTKGTAITATKGKLYLRGKANAALGNSNHTQVFKLSSTKNDIKIYGNILNLLNYEDKSKITSVPAYAFDGLFRDNTCISDISGLVLSSYTANSSCAYMFYGCTGLTTLSNKMLPATTLSGEACYKYMFCGCTGLTSIPSGFLPATSFSAGWVYQGMFQNCTGLTSIPTDLLPATTLYHDCYQNMFNGCSKLTNSCNLPATFETYDSSTIYSCYYYMFYQCTGLTTVNTISAKKLPKQTCYGMFAYCSSIASLGTIFPNLVSAEGAQCCMLMFQNCKGITTVDSGLLPATTTGERCYCQMFQWCDKLTNIPNLPATTVASYAYLQMFQASAIKTIGTDAISATTLSLDCMKLMFESCKSLTSVPTLKATTLAQGCYYQMFLNCTALESVNTNMLAATSIGDYSCEYMFQNCTALTAAPNIKATSVGRCGCMSMFEGCTAMTTGPSDLPATTLGLEAYRTMFQNCTAMTTVPSTLPATTVPDNAYRHMFYTCSKITNTPKISATSVGTNSLDEMFRYCSELVNIDFQTITSCGNYGFSYTFADCTKLDQVVYFNCTSFSDHACYGTFINTAVAISDSMSDPYYALYRLPMTGTGTVNSNALLDMFKGTKGTFTSTPSVNTNYYLKANVLAITSTSGTSFTFTNNNSTASLEYSLGDINTFYTLPKATAITASNGRLYLRGTGNTAIGNDSSGSQVFGISCSKNDIKLSGKLLNLLDYETNPTSIGTYAFRALFYNNTCISDISDLIMPSVTNEHSYDNMFCGCTHITSIPSKFLPAATLSKYCYAYMFFNCSGITSLAEDMMSATTLADYCCISMFYGTSGLTSIPEGLLPATTLAEGCYQGMFYSSGLTSLPAGLLPATTATTNCYKQMFQSCTGIKEIPSGFLPATTTNQYCYRQMFQSCSALTTIPSGLLSASNRLSYGCFYQMFYNCVNINSLPTIFNTSAAVYGYAFYQMFYCCSSIPSIPSSFFPSSCDTYSHYMMFYGCTKLASIPTNALGASTMYTYCYAWMFQNCTALTNACNLPSSTLKDHCYAGMYYGCTSLTSVSRTILANASTIASYSCYCMFYGCSKNTNFVILPATTLAECCYQGMFQNNNIDLQTEETYEYNGEYRIPSANTGTTATSALSNMFAGNAGNVTTPAINTTYYYKEAALKLKSASNTAFTFAVSNAVTVSLQGSYDGATYFTITNGTTYSPSNRMYIRGTGTTGICNSSITDTGTAFILGGTAKDIKVVGNILDLLNYTSRPSSLASYAFKNLFYGDTNLTDISKLKLPSFTSSYCYYKMFQGTGITSIPSGFLPATTVSNTCYGYMFNSCSEITSIPADLLPATNLVDYCYTYMFANCKKLTSSGIPETLLKGTVLDQYSYAGMFYNCTGLTTIPEKLFSSIGTTTIGTCSMQYMFMNCTGLTSIPAGLLGSINLGSNCLRGMFQSCTALTTLPEGLFANVTVKSSDVFYDMFKYCTGITSLPSGLFTGVDMGSYTWTCEGMFTGCSGLTELPEGLLPATKVASCGYIRMFMDCTNLEKIPFDLISATTAYSRSFEKMFENCRKNKCFVRIRETGNISDSCYYRMFYNNAHTLMTTQTEYYNTEYRVPYYGVGNNSSTKTTSAYPGYLMFGHDSGDTTASSAGDVSTVTLSTTYYYHEDVEAFMVSSYTDCNFTFKSNVAYNKLEYSFDNENWNTYTKGNTITTTRGKLYLRGTNNLSVSPGTSTSDNGSKFVFSCTNNDLYLKKDIRYLLEYSNISGITSFNSYSTGKGGQLQALFVNQTAIKNIDFLKIPAITAAYSYAYMFQYCTGITSIPKGFLPATTIYGSCYYNMFANCTGLTTIPTDLLPGTSLGSDCYWGMFRGCTKLTNVCYLPATSGGSYIYEYMFQNCTSLTSIPTGLMKIKSMPNNACQYMFAGCTGITAIPSDIFETVTSINNYCFKYMFNGCTGLTSANIPSNLLKWTWTYTGCYYGMFYGCTKLTYIPDNFLPTIAIGNQSPIAELCYAYMFQNCTGLTALPKNLLQSKYVGKNSYSYMFSGCTGIKEIPEGFLPARHLSIGSYKGMFQGCTGLTTIPGRLLPAFYLPQECYYRMFYGCSNLVVNTTSTSGYQSSFRMPGYIGPATYVGTTTTTTSGSSTTTTYHALSEMFTGTKGTLTGTPSAAKTYYVAGEDDITFRLESKSGTTFSFTSYYPAAMGLQYSLNNSTWTTITSGTAVSATGGKLYLRASNLPTISSSTSSSGTTTYSESTFITQVGRSVTTTSGGKTTTSSGYPWITISGATDIALKGEIANLIDYTNLDGIDHMFKYQFSYMFKSCTAISDISMLRLPGFASYQYTYHNMFYGCTGITSIPEFLLSTSYYTSFVSSTGKYSYTSYYTGEYTYGYMFDYCTGITSISEKLTQAFRYLSGYCLSNTFANTNITAIPLRLLSLFNSTNSGCYYGTFQNCTKLTSIPAGLLPSTSVGYDSYWRMFSGCTGITELPATLLPATSISTYSYEYMFYGCTKITKVPDGFLKANNCGSYSYMYMFSGCTSLTSIPTNLFNFTSIGNCGCQYMFYNCTALKNVVSFANITSISSYGCRWMYGKCTALTSAVNGLPSKSCSYYDCACIEMFSGCTSMTTPMESITLEISGYQSFYDFMYGCSKLTTIPNITITSTLHHTSFSVSNITTYNIPNNIVIIIDNLHIYYNNKELSTSEYQFNTNKTAIIISETYKKSTLTIEYDYRYVLAPRICNYMFQGCTSLADLSSKKITYQYNFIKENYVYNNNIVNGYQFAYMFQGCTKMTKAPKVDITSGFSATDTIPVYYMNYMFGDCTSLTVIPGMTIKAKLSNCSLAYMFQNCTSLQISNSSSDYTTTAITCTSTSMSGTGNSTSSGTTYRMLYNIKSKSGTTTTIDITSVPFTLYVNSGCVNSYS